LGGVILTHFLPDLLMDMSIVFSVAMSLLSF